jgi:hypothetical protein
MPYLSAWPRRNTLGTSQWLQRGALLCVILFLAVARSRWPAKHTFGVLQCHPVTYRLGSAEFVAIASSTRKLQNLCILCMQKHLNFCIFQLANNVIKRTGERRIFWRWRLDSKQYLWGQELAFF